MKYIPYIIDTESNRVQIIEFIQTSRDIMDLVIMTKIFDIDVYIFSKLLLYIDNDNKPQLKLVYVSRQNKDSDMKFVIEDLNSIYYQTVIEVLNSPVFNIAFTLWDNIWVSTLSTKSIEKQYDKYIYPLLHQYIYETEKLIKKKNKDETLLETININFDLQRKFLKSELFFKKRNEKLNTIEKMFLESVKEIKEEQQKREL